MASSIIISGKSLREIPKDHRLVPGDAQGLRNYGGARSFCSLRAMMSSQCGPEMATRWVSRWRAKQAEMRSEAGSPKTATLRMSSSSPPAGADPVASRW